MGISPSVQWTVMRGKSVLRRKLNLGLLLWKEQPGEVWSLSGSKHSKQQSENIIQCLHNNQACGEWLSQGCESLAVVQVEK